MFIKDVSVVEMVKMKVHIRYIGHSTFLLHLNSEKEKISIMTDPWFDKGTFYLKRIVPPAVDLEKIQKCDFLLVSHSHRDHLDHVTLKYARKKWDPTIIGPPSVVSKAKKYGISKTVTAHPGASLNMDNFTVNVVRAVHPVWGGKDAVGYVIVLDGCTIYFSGDTLYVDEVVKDVNNFKIHVAILPIGSVKFLFRKAVMDIYDAIKFALDIQPKIVIPMHYNVLKGTEANPEEMKKPLAEKGIELRILNPGDTTIIECTS